MANEWQTVRVEDIAEKIAMGPFGSDIKTDNFVPKGVPVIRGVNLTNGRFHGEGFVFLTEEKANDLANANAFPGDLVFTHRGTLGQVGLIPNQPFSRYVVSQSQMKLACNKQKALSEFIYYFFKSPAGQAALLANTSQTGVPAISRPVTSLKAIRLRLPPIAEQRAIAHILGTLDDKIELNRKQNETLEAMARALFKAWFVDFEPVRAKMEGRWQRGQSLPGLPAHLYDLFPDRLVESELGEIPEGWRVFSFGDVAQQGKGAVNPTDEPGERFTHYSIPAFDASKMPVIELGGSIKSNKTPVPDGAVLVSKLNPHIPRVWLVGQAGDRAVCSTEFIVWAPKPPANSAFLYCLASSSEFVESMCQLVTGTSNSHQRVKPDQLREIRVFAANENVIAAFSNMVEALMNQVLQNSQQSRTLAQLRDTLLPKLISGELRVKDAERFLEAAT
ncbi:restriction endonuclease subunit S [Zestomonas thermotolerans]|uniref:restriction endonuclease subunit S n=1 Tax=Zestomonas thermotolerans TaxID=157784 RepID=UPI0003618484|nr:restriction endonuclease subunit S [Pseudomonas thermotolerans]